MGDSCVRVSQRTDTVAGLLADTDGRTEGWEKAGADDDAHVRCESRLAVILLAYLLSYSIHHSYLLDYCCCSCRVALYRWWRLCDAGACVRWHPAYYSHTCHIRLRSHVFTLTWVRMHLLTHLPVLCIRTSPRRSPGDSTYDPIIKPCAHTHTYILY